MTPLLAAIVAALPWMLTPVIIARRARDRVVLGDYSDAVTADCPSVTVVVPARDEERNIERCLRSILASSYPRLDVIVVDDASQDRTAALAQRVADRDSRVKVISCPPLPRGWFGKPWACAAGAAAACGDLLCFTDADTAHAPDLLARSVTAMRTVDAALFSVAGRQEMGTFWEKIVQPQLFTMIAARYGGADRINRSSHVHDKIANGQFILVSHPIYDSLGGHAAVRDKVAEDLMLAQHWFAARQRVCIIAGVEQLTTRMYRSLGEIIRGWQKNVYAGSADALPSIRGRGIVHPALMVAVPALTLAPVLALVASLVVGWGAPALWGALAAIAQVAWWGTVYLWLEESPLYAFAFPLGAALLGYIIVTAVWRGHHVQWKGRVYSPGV
ncbi:MAG: hypothetical protein NVS4B3_24080 [Gemmatimonadaceae bacterium]